MPQKLARHQNLHIINMYRDGWELKAIQRKLDLMGNLFGWFTIKNVIKKYQRGQIGYAHPDQEPIPAFKGVSDNDIVEIQNEFMHTIINRYTTQVGMQRNPRLNYNCKESHKGHQVYCIEAKIWSDG